MARKKAAPRRNVKKAAGRKTKGAGSGRNRAGARKAGRKQARKPARKAARRAGSQSRKQTATRKNATAKRASSKNASRKNTATARSGRPRSAAAAPPGSAPARTPRLERQRRVLTEERDVPGVPSSLDLDRRGSSVRTGREELNERQRHHATMSPGITGGDVDADVENAYFSGEEAPGGDTPTPDQDVVEEIGQALGIQYQDNEELQGGEEVAKRDRHRWELDPASAEDYLERNNKK